MPKKRCIPFCLFLTQRFFFGVKFIKLISNIKKTAARAGFFFQ
jgi:hypothetical protein